MSLKIIEYLIELYSQIISEDQRTLADEILKEGMMNEEIGYLSLHLNNFKSCLEETGNKNTCNFDCR